MKKLISILLWMPLMAWASMTNQPVSLITSGEPLFVVARTIEKSVGKKVVLQDLPHDQLVSGTFMGINGAAFMDQFASRNKIVWALRNDSIVLAPAGTDLTVKIRPDEKKIATSSFTSVLYDPKDPNKLGLMIFQVHNAWADNRQLGSNAVPGVANLFAQYVGIPMARPTTGSAAPAPSARVQREAPTNSQTNQIGIMSLFKQPAPTTQSAPVEPETASADVHFQSRGVYADGRLNAVLVRDKVANFQTYKTIIALLDRPTDMVQLDAMIVDLQKDTSLQYGMDWTSNTTLTGGTGSIILGATAGAKLLAKIRAAQTSKEATAVSVPSVVTLNNTEASFNSSQDVYIPVSGAYDTSLNKVTADTSLRVTPLIANDDANVPYNERRVKLLVNVKDGSVVEPTFNKVGTSATVAQTNQSQLTTQAVVRSGDMLVIGGQIIRKKMEGSSGIPGLSSIPVIGGIFGVKSDTFVEYLRVYIIRTRILGEDSHTANAVTEPVNPRFLEALEK